MTTEVVVVHTKFIAHSRASKEALKSASLLKNLPLNAIILGEKGTGKTTLAKHISKAPIIHAKNTKELIKMLNETDELIIKDFQHLSQPLHIKKILLKRKVHIIATATHLEQKTIDTFFSVKILLPPLAQREEDILPLCDFFTQQITKNLSIETIPKIQLQTLKQHIHNNAHSLKKFIYLYALTNSLNSDEFLYFCQDFFLKRLKLKEEYRELLPFFDVPLIKAGLKKYGSQLALSQALNINRNTLRKKINENKKYFKGFQ